MKESRSAIEFTAKDLFTLEKWNNEESYSVHAPLIEKFREKNCQDFPPFCKPSNTNMHNERIIMGIDPGKLR
jgi:hypothetical protein